MSARTTAQQGANEWLQAVLDRSIELLKVAVLQGRSSVAFQVLADSKPLDLVASIAPAWSFSGGDDCCSPVPAMHGGAQGVRVCIFKAKSGEFLFQSKPIGFSGNLAPGPQVPLLDLPDVWVAEQFAGVAAWCWGAVVAALQSGRVQASVSLPRNGNDTDTSRIELACALAVDPFSSGLFLTVTHARTGAVIGCSTVLWPDSLDPELGPNYQCPSAGLDA